MAYLPVVVVVGTLLVAVIVIYRLRRDANEDLTPDSEKDLLTEFERAYAAGEMDEAEFRRVRDLLLAGKPSGPVAPISTEPNPPPSVEGPAEEPPSS